MTRLLDKKRRLFVVTAGNIRSCSLQVGPHPDIFRADYQVQARSKANRGSPVIEIVLDGMNEVVQATLAAVANAKKPRAFLCDNPWVKRFFNRHSVDVGDILAIERLGLRQYRLSVDEQVSKASRTFRFAEFFAGIGLMRMGLQKSDSRWECVFANDFDPTKRSIYAANFACSQDEIDDTDVHLLASKSVPDVDLATASFPCTDLSIAGGRAGIRCGESSAFWGFHRVLKDMGRSRRPPMVLLENVTGLLTSNDGRDFYDALQALNKLGYLVDAFVVDAKWFVPQSRPRLFIVGMNSDLAAKSSVMSLEESRLRPLKLASFIRENATEIKWSIKPLPNPPTRSSHSLRSIIRDPAKGHEDWWSQERTEYLCGQMFEKNKQWVRDNLHSAQYQYATAFRRMRMQPDGSIRSTAELRTDGIAGCLRTPKGGSARQILLRAGRGTVNARLLSAVECASLMGADGYNITGSLNQALFGFGDAVCVDVVRWISDNYLLPMLRIE